MLAASGISVRRTNAVPVVATADTMEEDRAYRRREVRRRKKVFQSRIWLAVLGAEVVETERVLHSEGVKKDVGVELEGGFAASGASS